jgi:antitoxin component YwqK of YwqJK toxin-antitoxin module
MARPAPFLISLVALMGMFIGCEPANDSSGPFVNIAGTEIRTEKGINYVNGEIFTGTLFESGDRGDTLRLSCYWNGKEHGTWKQFYDDGLLKEVRYFKRGKKVGEHKGWWENGQLKFLYHLENDEYEGTSQEWSADGLLIREANYKAGYEEGVQKAWYASGKIKSNYIMKEGRRFGLLGTKNCINVSDSVFNFN